VTIKKAYTAEQRLCPEVLTLPHVLFSANTSLSLFSDAMWKSHAKCYIQAKKDPYTNDLIMRAVAEATVEIWDFQDWMRALESPDPVPTQNVVLEQRAPVDDLGELQSAGQAMNSPIVPTTPVSRHHDAAANVTIPAVLSSSSSGTTLSGSVDIDESGTNIAAVPLETPISGSPDDAADPESAHVEEGTRKKKKYKYTGSDAQAELVIYVYDGDEVPSGYVPA
jgi:hypothetical protein